MRDKEVQRSYGSIASLGLNARIVNAIAGPALWNRPAHQSRHSAVRLLVSVPVFVESSKLSDLAPEFEDREFAIRYFGVSLDNTEVIMGSGVDTDLFTPSPEPEGIPVVMLPSRMLWNKGIEEFVSSAEIVKAQGIPSLASSMAVCCTTSL